jgi:hypothetical protein
LPALRDKRALPADRIEVLFHAIPTDHFNARSQLGRATRAAALESATTFCSRPRSSAPIVV